MSKQDPQISISNDPNGFLLEFGHWVIGDNLELGIWYLEFQICLSPATPIKT
jgi:hypothetical protein